MRNAARPSSRGIEELGSNLAFATSNADQFASLRARCRLIPYKARVERPALPGRAPTTARHHQPHSVGFIGLFG